MLLTGLTFEDSSDPWRTLEFVAAVGCTLGGGVKSVLPTFDNSVPGGNSTIFSFPASAPLEEIVPSGLIVTTPGGRVIGCPVSPSTALPAPSTNCPPLDI